MDWERAKEIAFGALNLSHDKFYRLTAAELIELFEGWEWRENREVEKHKALHELEMRRLSVLASWITAPHAKKPLKPTDFYPDKLESNKKTTTPEETRRTIEEIQKQMGVKI